MKTKRKHLKITSKTLQEYPTVHELNQYLNDRQRYVCTTRRKVAQRLTQDHGLKPLFAEVPFEGKRLYIFWVIDDIDLPW